MKKVITFGVFDYFHLGHLRLFENCKKQGDYLIVAVQNEDYIRMFKPETEILYSTDERIEMVQALKVVDEVIVYNAIGPDILKMVDFDVLVLGEDQRHEGFVQAQCWCEANGKEIIRLRRTQGISSSSVKTKVKGME